MMNVPVREWLSGSQHTDAQRLLELTEVMLAVVA